VYAGSTIVCAVDDSDRGLAAARVAADLSARLDRPLVGAHAVAPLPLTAAGIPHAVPPPDARATARYEAAAGAHARTVLEDAGADDAHLRTAVGAIANVLLGVADDEDALLLVLGTPGAGALRSILLGSVTEAVLRSADRPVLLVPAGAEGLAPGPVVAAVGGPRDAAWIPLAELLASRAAAACCSRTSSRATRPTTTPRSPRRSRGSRHLTQLCGHSDRLRR